MGETDGVTFDYDGDNFTMKIGTEDLVGCQWVPQSGDIRFVLIFFHGLGAFASINRTYFPPILKSGGAIIATDHLGHGRSPGDRGLTSTQLLLEEIKLLINRANVLFPETPLFLYGHSMGGLAAISFVLEEPRVSEKLNGLIIEAPWLNETDAMMASIPANILGKFGHWLFPTLTIGTGSGFGETHYPAGFMDSYSKCKLPHDAITPRLYASSCEMRRMIQHIDKWPPHLNLLFMQGAKDTSVGVNRNMKWVDSLRNKFPELVQIAWHKDAEHAMLRHEDGDIIVREVVNFMFTCLERETAVHQ